MPITRHFQLPYPTVNDVNWHASFVSMISQIDTLFRGTAEDRNLLLLGGGTITYDATGGEIDFTENLKIATPSTGAMLTINVIGGITMRRNGEMLMATVSRGVTSARTITPSVVTSIPTNGNAVLIAYRFENQIYFRNNFVISDGESASFSESTSSSDREDFFDLDNTTWSFTLTATPNLGCKPIVSINGIVQTVEDDYSIDDDQITLTERDTWIDVSDWTLCVRYWI